MIWLVSMLSRYYHANGAFTLDVKSVLNENVGGTQCWMGDSLMLSEC
jgi:hypothetical protein